MEIVAVDAFRPDWERWTQFLRTRSQAFEVDALESTRSIEYPVASPDDAAGMFDTLTYTKGAAVLRMLEQYLGDDRFRDGIRKYLADHRFGNTETHDLWEAIESATGEPVRRIMDGWIWQGGYPMVSASPAGRAGACPAAPLPASGGGGDGVWDVPLLVRHGGGRTEPVLIEPEGALVAAGCGRGARRRERRRPTRSSASGTTRRCSIGSRSPWGSCRRRSGHSSSTTPGPRSWSGRSIRLGFLRFAGAFGGETELPVWLPPAPGHRLVRALPRGTPRASTCGRGSAASSGPALERIGWEPQRGRARPGRAAAGDAPLGSLAVLGAEPPRRSPGRSRSSGSGADAGGGGPVARVRLDRHRRRRRKGRGVLEAFLEGRGNRTHPAGATPLPLRAVRVPRRHADRPHGRARAQRGGPPAERARAVRPLDRQPGPGRAGVAVREGALGGDRRAPRALDDRVRGGRRPIPLRRLEVATPRRLRRGTRSRSRRCSSGRSSSASGSWPATRGRSRTCTISFFSRPVLAWTPAIHAGSAFAPETSATTRSLGVGGGAGQERRERGRPAGLGHQPELLPETALRICIASSVTSTTCSTNCGTPPRRRSLPPAGPRASPRRARRT